MGIPDATTLGLVEQLWQQTAGQTLTPAQAKLYSNHVLLSLRQPGLRRFSAEDVAARLEEAERLLDSANMLRSANPRSGWRKAAKRAAELLEWLGHEEVVSEHVPTTILAAAAYQVAGYPALARGLLSQGPQGPHGLVEHFLAANFSALLAASHVLLAELAGEAVDYLDQRIDRAIVTETARCFGLLAASMRWGDDDRVAPALEKLGALAGLARHSQVAYSAITAHLFALVASEYIAASVWPQLNALAEGASESGRRAYHRFGRAAFLRSRSLAWPSQSVGIDRLRTGESFVLCTPTGSGKTTVAELALIGDLFGRTRGTGDDDSFDDTAGLALYLVPSRALAAEVEARLEGDLGNIGDQRLTVTGLYGGTDWGPTDAWLTRESPTVLVCTYEKAEALLRFLGPVFMRRVRVVIIDEAHSVQFNGNTAALQASEDRSLRLEALATRLLRVLDGCTYRLIALSAVSAGLEGSLARWLVGRANAEPAHSDYRSTRQLVGRLECLPGGFFKIYYDLLDRSSLAFTDTDAAPFVPHPFPKHPPAPSFEREGPLVRLRPYLAWAALQLAQQDADGRPHSVLVSITSHITAYAKSFLTLLEQDWKEEALPKFFLPPTAHNEVRLWEQCLATASDYFTEASPEYRLLIRGIAVHHGKMPALLGRRLKGIIESGIVRIVLATSTLSEGVNLPVEYILVPDVHRGRDVLTTQEFLNLVGRAGRPGHGTEGRTLVLVPPEPGSSRSADAYSARRLIQGYWQLIERIRHDGERAHATEAVSPLACLLMVVRQEWAKLAGDAGDSVFEAWLESTRVEEPSDASELSSAVASLDALDAVLMATVEEVHQLNEGRTELSPADLEDALRKIWDRTFAKVAASTEAILSRTFIRRGRSIPALYPDPNERRRIYKTSLPPLSARELLRRVASIREHLEGGNGYARMPPEERYLFVEQTVILIASIKRFAPDPKIGNAKADWKVVLRWWLDPRGASKRPKPDQIGSWHEYAARNFTYKANWGLGSVTSLCLDTVQGSAAPVALSLDDWSKTGLPWVAFWLKELLTWGTLEPVAAFLLARGGAVTRSDAEAMAGKFYDAHLSDDSNALLDPRQIRDWIESTKAPGIPRATEVAPRAEFGVHLEQPVNAWYSEKLRVFPTARIDEGTVEWFDMAGYHVASCGSSLLEPEWDAAATDFLLDIARELVVVTPYL